MRRWGELEKQVRGRVDDAKHDLAAIR
jgi:hypothetical protein